MMETTEFNAATVEEAAEKAAASLGLSLEEVLYEVLDPGSSGFMGIGARDARIAVRIEVLPVRKDSPPVSNTPSEVHDVPQARIEEPTSPGPEVIREAATEAVPDEVLDEVRKFMDAAMNGLDLSNARLDVYDAGEFVAVDVTAEEAGLFIGQKGETIDALQYLANVSAYKNRSFSKRIILDSEGYRQRRTEAIQGMAHRTARRAMREQREIELPPMNPAERRIVHMYLKENTEVSTFSEGSGENRRVKISPA
ncbi:MAG: RNA-binding cell elongation regulator Jag/EloR [Rubrobacteraceae bacterium]